MTEIISTPGTCGGRPRLAGRRITVQHIIEHIERGMLLPTVAYGFNITVADVRVAIDYYLQHHTEIDDAIERDKAQTAMRPEVRKIMDRVLSENTDIWKRLAEY